MARNFVTGSLQYFERSASAYSSFPVTLAAWIRVPNHSQVGAFMQYGHDTINSNLRLGIQNATGLVLAQKKISAAGAVNTYSTIAASVNVWHHVAAVYYSDAITFRPYLDGVAGGLGGQVGAVNINNTTIGVSHRNASYGAYLTGDVAEAAIWDAELTIGEIAVLNKGYSPLFVRPESLVSYWPLLWRTSPEIDLASGFNLTIYNAPTNIQHPPVLYRNPAQPRALTATPVATGIMPMLQKANLGNDLFDGVIIS